MKEKFIKSLVISMKHRHPKSHILGTMVLPESARSGRHRNTYWFWYQQQLPFSLFLKKIFGKISELERAPKAKIQWNTRSEKFYLPFFTQFHFTFLQIKKKIQHRVHINNMIYSFFSVFCFYLIFFLSYIV